MKKTYTEKRYLYADNLRAFCIKNDFYNAGTNEEYSNLFSKLREPHGFSQRNITTARLADIAQDILDHTDGHDILDTETLMHWLATEVCVYTFREN